MLTKNIPEMNRRTLEHIAADRVIQGFYWGATNSDGFFKYHKNGEVTPESKGCFIGCLTHSQFAHKVTEEFGIEVNLVLTLEAIFEAQDPEDAILFFRDIPLAIGCDGKCLGNINAEFDSEIVSSCIMDVPKVAAALILKMLKDAPMGNV